jgi:hypothetical protein
MTHSLLTLVVPDDALNMTQSMLLRGDRFLVAFAERVVDYHVWHVAYGNFECAR